MTYEASIVIPKRPIDYYGHPTHQLGQGTYGTVNKYEGGSSEPVAIKTMTDAEEDGISSTTLREISILIMLNHPNVINVIDVLVTPKKVSIVMPLANMDLRGFIGNPIAIRRSLPDTYKSIAYQIINGVNYCISKGIINRDIKPPNVLIYSDGTVKIADLGLARHSICSLDSGITQEVYSLWYRPPEIILGSKYNSSADVWAVGCTLYELYTNTPLFPGMSPDNMMTLIGEEFGNLEIQWPGIVNLPDWNRDRIVKETYPKLKKFPDDTTMREIITSMLAIDPDHRARLQDVLQNPYFDSVRNRVSEDIHTYACSQILETRAQRSTLTLPARSKIQLSHIQELVNWLYEVAESFKLQRQSFYLSQILLEKYLSIKLADPQDLKLLQLYGCACLNVASRIIEVYNPEISELVYITANTYTRQQIIEASTNIVEVLGFDLVHSTAVDFLSVFLDAGNYTPSVKRLSYVLLRLLSTISSTHFNYTPEELALGCLQISCTYNRCSFKHTSHLSPRITKLIADFVNLDTSKITGDFAGAITKAFNNLGLGPEENLSTIQKRISTQ